MWSPSTGKQIGKVMAGHKSWITGLAWEPLHIDGACKRFVSASKDTNVHIWDAITQNRLVCLSTHMASVTCVIWGGQVSTYRI